ncbi:MAG: lactonase family protein [Nibricoccus sp.]
MTRVLRLAASAILWFVTGSFLQAVESFVYFGTTNERNTSEGIYVARFDSDSGKLSPATLAAKIDSPAFINFHPNKLVLYSVGETKTASGKTQGHVSAFATDRSTGALTLLNRQPGGGDALCYVLVDAAGHVALTAAYRDGFVAAHPLREDGSLGEYSSLIRHTGSSVGPRQKSPHAHNIDLDPANRFALVADLGTDQVVTYRLDPAAGTLSPQSQPFRTKLGAGPRHIAFGPSGRHVYILNEIDNTLIAADYDSTTGHLKEKQIVPLLPSDFKDQSTAAEVVVHPSGKFLYASNRGFDSLALFSIEPTTGKLTFVEYVREGVNHPRHFAIDPSGHWLLCANRDANTVTVYRIALDSGRLSPTGSAIRIPMPTCVKFRTP